MKHETTYLRGARSFAAGRFETLAREPFDDGWTPEEKDAAELQTSVTEERARSIISRNDSPDIGFAQSINPYRGCEHGCIYCYARPSHAYLELSPGLDFETKLFAKTNAAELLREELSRPGYKPSPIALGSLDRALARKLEPRAASPQRRLDVLKALSNNKIPCGVMVAALIPALNDKTMEQVLEAASTAGATEAAYVILRLPNELKTLFKEWLAAHYPERAEHVISIVRQMRGGRENDPDFGTRMSGTGKFAELVEKRFEIACRRFGLNAHGAGREPPGLDCSRFRPPAAGGQMALF